MHKATGRSLQYNNEVNQQHRYPGIVISRKYQDILGQQNLHKGSSSPPLWGTLIFLCFFPMSLNSPRGTPCLRRPRNTSPSASARVFPCSSVINLAISFQGENKQKTKQGCAFLQFSGSQKRIKVRNLWRERAMIYVSQDCTVKGGQLTGPL